MLEGIKKEVIVGEGGLIVIHDPWLKVGMQVEVIIIPLTEDTSPEGSMPLCPLGGKPQEDSKGSPVGSINPSKDEP